MMRTFLAASLLTLLMALPAQAGSVTLDCPGRGDGFFSTGLDDETGFALSGFCRLTIYVDDTGDPSGTRIEMHAIFRDDPTGRVLDAGYGGFHVEEGSIRFAIDLNEGRAGQGYATLYGDWIHPNMDFPSLHGASGDFQLADGYGEMTGTMSVNPEPTSIVMMAIGIAAVVLVARRSARRRDTVWVDPSG